MNNLTKLSLYALAIATLTSMSLGALSHMFIVIPIVVYYFQKPETKFSKSQYALFFLTLIMAASVFVNYEIMVKGLSVVFKLKYYLVAALAVGPIQKMFDELDTEKREKLIKKLITTLLICTSVASIYGVFRVKLGFNPLGLSYSDAHRNTGFFGMVLNYAHNLAFVLVFICGLIANNKRTKKYVNLRFLITALVINVLGIYFAYSRGAILAVLAGLPFLFFYNHIKVFCVFAIIVLIATMAFLFHPAIKINRIGSDKERLAQWETAYVAFKEKPVFGYGYLNFEHNCKEIKERNHIGQRHYCGHAHNIFLETMASTGVFGILAMMSWLVLWIMELVKRRDLGAELILPLIIVFIIGGLTQATFTLGANLFLIMGIYTLSQVRIK